MAAGARGRNQELRIVLPLGEENRRSPRPNQSNPSPNRGKGGSAEEGMLGGKTPRATTSRLDCPDSPSERNAAQTADALSLCMSARAQSTSMPSRLEPTKTLGGGLSQVWRRGGRVLSTAHPPARGRAHTSFQRARRRWKNGEGEAHAGQNIQQTSSTNHFDCSCWQTQRRAGLQKEWRGQPCAKRYNPRHRAAL